MYVAFRVDASRFIGSGHVMRCLVLARMLRASGATVRFICRLHPGHLVDLIRAEGFACDALACLSPSPSPPTSEPDYWLGAASDLDALEVVEVLGGHKPDWLVVDHYGIGEEWQRVLRPHCGRLMVIDDLANRRHDCDLLLDQNLADQQQSRYDSLVDERCIKLLGPRYALLHPDYISLHQQSLPRCPPVRRVFAYFGAANSASVCGRVVRAFSQLAGDDVTLDVVASPASASWAELADQVRNDARVRLHGYVPSLAPLLQDADVAFGAGGATSWERCCVGVPSYVVTLAENQVSGTQALSQHGAIRWLGDVASLSDADLLAAMQEALAGGGLKAMSRAALTLVDGWGSARVAAALSATTKVSFVARAVEAEDEHLILDWANDPEVRQSSFSVRRIDAEEHHRWFTRQLANAEGGRFYVLETATGLPVGPVRFESLSPSRWELHYSMDRCIRGRGLGGAFLKAALAHFREDVTSADLVVGRIKASNHASQQVFRKLGFVETEDAQGLLYQLNLQRLDLR